MSQFTEWLKRKIVSLGVSGLEKFAAQAGMSRGTILAIAKRGTLAHTTPGTRKLLADGLGVPLTDLLALAEWSESVRGQKLPLLAAEQFMAARMVAAPAPPDTITVPRRAAELVAEAARMMSVPPLVTGAPTLYNVVVPPAPRQSPSKSQKRKGKREGSARDE